MKIGLGLLIVLISSGIGALAGIAHMFKKLTDNEPMEDRLDNIDSESALK